MTKRVIVDVDAGIDDILAILLLVCGDKSSEVKIEAITCVKGNTTVDNVYKNVQRILKITGKEHVPVYVGSREPLVPFEQFCEPFYYGKDGFGDLQYEDDEITIKGKFSGDSLSEKNNNLTVNDYSENAMTVINRIVMDNPKEISLICLAPLTNIALAMKINPFLAMNLKDIFIMGGNFHDGNNCTASTAELNFLSDPEAAFIVLRNVDCPVTILPKETCEATTISCNWRFNTLGKVNNQSIRLLNEAEKQYFVDQTYWITYDAFLVAAFLDPQLIEKQKNECVSVNLSRDKTRGEMLVHNQENNEPNSFIITKLNEDLFKRFLLTIFCGNN